MTSYRSNSSYFKLASVAGLLCEHGGRRCTGVRAAVPRLARSVRDCFLITVRQPDYGDEAFADAFADFGDYPRRVDDPSLERNIVGLCRLTISALMVVIRRRSAMYISALPSAPRKRHRPGR